jgi:hypothetical protein
MSEAAFQKRLATAEPDYQAWRVEFLKQLDALYR